MSAELVSILLQFQPDAPELKQRREYDTAARAFVLQLSNISASHWLKGADTQQDVLEVRAFWYSRLIRTVLILAGTQPLSEHNSVRLRPPSPHRRDRREEEYTRRA